MRQQVAFKHIFWKESVIFEFDFAIVILAGKKIQVHKSCNLYKELIKNLFS